VTFAWCGSCTVLVDSRFFWVALVAALAGLVRGFSGFGAALIFVPLGGMVYDAKTAVLLLWIVDGCGALPFLPPHLRRARWHEVVPLVIGSTIAMPAGVWILTHGDPYWLRWAVSGVVLLSTLALASGWRYHRAASLGMTISVGGAAGLSSGAVGIGGPPLVLFWLGGQANAAQARSNIFAYFAVTTLTAMAAYLWQGILTPAIVLLGLALVPIYVAALFAGDRVFRHSGETGFRRMAFWLCGLAAILGMPVWN